MFRQLLWWYVSLNSDFCHRCGRDWAPWCAECESLVSDLGVCLKCKLHKYCFTCSLELVTESEKELFGGLWHCPHCGSEWPYRDFQKKVQAPRLFGHARGAPGFAIVSVCPTCGTAVSDSDLVNERKRRCPKCRKRKQPKQAPYCPKCVCEMFESWECPNCGFKTPAHDAAGQEECPNCHGPLWHKKREKIEIRHSSHITIDMGKPFKPRNLNDISDW